jgi:hypothetical protein
MRSTLLPDVVRFLNALEETQEALLAVFTAKRTAIDNLQPEVMERLSLQEGELARRLQTLAGQRAELLNRARRAGMPAATLLELTGAIGKTERDARIRSVLAAVEEKIRWAQRRTTELQRESWVQWIVSHRSYNHYTELLELIAHGGQAAPTYGAPTGTHMARGVILDAAG